MTLWRISGVCSLVCLALFVVARFRWPHLDMQVASAAGATIFSTWETQVALPPLPPGHPAGLYGAVPVTRPHARGRTGGQRGFRGAGAADLGARFACGQNANIPASTASGNPR